MAETEREKANAVIFVDRKITGNLSHHDLALGGDRTAALEYGVSTNFSGGGL